MDQDGFRELLATARTVPKQPTVTPAVFSKSFQKKSTVSHDSAVSAFKPRKHGSHNAKAHQVTQGREDTEGQSRVGIIPVSHGLLKRVQGQGNDRNVESPDLESDLISPAKGLDFDLLERERSKLREEQHAIDDVMLEEALQDATAPRKRTREDIIQSLKKIRTGDPPHNADHDKRLDVAKQAGKFRPIGAPEQPKPKKRKNKTEDPEQPKKKKKRKVEEDQANISTREQATNSGTQHTNSPQVPAVSRPKARTPSPDIDADADIFSGIGQYRGIESGSEDKSDDDAEIAGTSIPRTTSVHDPMLHTKANWFGDAAEHPQKPAPASLRVPKPESPRETDDTEMEEDIPTSTRLQGLSSSAMPSIKEILAMDEAAEREEKRKARKEKKKNKKPSEETKINREAKQ
ncbi:hypothetical protein FRC17_010022 [Serendipita sp. 399]|nr:hypothetical protein FRC17_010022 [Serendipita sp. 399]